MSGRVEDGHVPEPCEERERGTKYNSQQAKGSKRYKRGRATKVSGLYREEPLGEEQPSPWAGKLRAEGAVCQPHPVTGRDCGTVKEPGGLVHFSMLNKYLNCPSFEI